MNNDQQDEMLVKIVDRLSAIEQQNMATNKNLENVNDRIHDVHQRIDNHMHEEESSLKWIHKYLVILAILFLVQFAVQIPGGTEFLKIVYKIFI